MNTVFKNQLNELRSGWQIAIFVLLFAGASAALVVPMVEVLKIRDAFATGAASLAAVLIATWIATRSINRKPFTAVGLAVNRHTMRELGLGCLIGWLMVTGIFGVEYVLGYVKVVAVEFPFVAGLQVFCVSLAFFAVAAMVEEILFRGYVFQTLVRGIRFIPSVIVMGAMFGFAHFRNPNASAFGLINTALVSVLFCVAYWRTRSLWLPFGIHVAWNFFQTTVYGYPTSGIHFTGYELTTLTQFGSEWLTGGAYGPEGGALATLVILLCGVYLCFSRTLRPHPGIVTLEREGENLGAQFLERPVPIRMTDASPTGAGRPAV